MPIFTTNYLGADGILVLRFIGHHAGSRVASEIARGLYEAYEKKEVSFSCSYLFSSFDCCCVVTFKINLVDLEMELFETTTIFMIEDSSWHLIITVNINIHLFVQLFF